MLSMAEQLRDKLSSCYIDVNAQMAPFDTAVSRTKKGNFDATSPAGGSPSSTKRSSSRCATRRTRSSRATRRPNTRTGPGRRRRRTRRPRGRPRWRIRARRTRTPKPAARRGRRWKPRTGRTSPSPRQKRHLRPVRLPVGGRPHARRERPDEHPLRHGRTRRTELTGAEKRYRTPTLRMGNG